MAIEAEKQAVEQGRAPHGSTTKKDRSGKSTKSKEKEAEVGEKPQKAKRIPRLPKGPKEEKQAPASGISGHSAGKPVTTPISPEPPLPPKDAPRYSEYEHIVYIRHDELLPFKNNPFQIRDDDAMKSLVESVKERGVDQPALVRPREGGGFEIVSSHRRQHASELAGYANIPYHCSTYSLTDVLMGKAKRLDTKVSSRLTGILVDLRGFEPLASYMRSKRSPS